MLKPDVGGVEDCYEAGGEKSCHIVGQAYLFGEATNQGVAQTAEETAFGIDYRAAYGDIIKNGLSQTAMMSWVDAAGLFNKIDIDALAPYGTTSPYPTVCPLFDVFDQYGNI